MARIFQHEIDHTNGIVFIDHIKEDPQAFFELKGDGKLSALDYTSVIANKDLWE
ncbi:MAG TPA: peptide deformylase [Candidatus Saccharimonadales bacterium]